MGDNGNKQLFVELGERSYPIYIGTGLIDRLAEYGKEHGITTKSPLLIVTDSHVAPLHLEKAEAALRSGGYEVHHHIVPAGEASKSLQNLSEIIGTALKAGLDRSSAIVALGGGVVGDMAGFAAASYMRGAKFVQIPTTILAHDSSVGGKVAVNHPLAKNVIGAFYQPEMVVYDLDLLKTLPEREVRAGLAEVVKHGFLWDERFALWCEEHAEELVSLDEAALRHALYTGCHIKVQVVSQDERENDLRAILNLGHTIGHALEAVTGYTRYLHGEAISIGMVGSALLAERFGYGAEIHAVTKRILQKLGLPVAIDADLDVKDIMQAMMSDKKFREGQMVFIVPTRIGAVEIRKDTPYEWVEQIVTELKGEE